MACHGIIERVEQHCSQLINRKAKDSSNLIILSLPVIFRREIISELLCLSPYYISACIAGVCYDSVAPGPNKEYPRCATERVEAVTSLDILYNDFHNKTMETMQSSDFKKSCGLKYPCPDGEPGCETR